MVEFIGDLDWNWNGINSKGIENFLKFMDKTPLKISRGNILEKEKDNKVNVQFYNEFMQDHFIVSPAKGIVNYELHGFNDERGTISYHAKGSRTDPLKKHECFQIESDRRKFYFLTKPLNNSKR